MSGHPISAYPESMDVEPSERVREALTSLRERGERVTPGRRAVLEVLDRSTTHLDAEAIALHVARSTPGVHRATVYRTLQSLTEIGILTHTHVPGSATIYHLAPASADHSHTHMQCSRCERVFDLPVSELEDLRDSVRRSSGFDIDPRHAALLGTCRDCTDD